MKMTVLAAIGLVAMGGFSANSLQPSETASSLNASVASKYLALAKGESDDGDTICTPNKTFQGCCSNQGGIADIRGDLITCKSGATSASCSGIDIDLSGCCSKNDGVARVDSSGRILCSNDEESPTCRLNACANGGSDED